MTVRFLEGHARPEKMTTGSSGYDIRFSGKVPVTINPTGEHIFETDIFIAMLRGEEAQVRGRSGLWFNHSIFTPTGTIDSDFRGEIKVKLKNLGHLPYTVNPGDRIAQLVFSTIEVEVGFLPVYKLPETDRKGGFGHTGKQ